MVFSQNGFPALEPGSATLHKWIVPGTDRYFQLRGGSAGFILCHFILWFHERIEKINQRGAPWDDWAFAYRLIRGSDTAVSNHASGTAVDLNATGHPLGLSGTFPKIAVARIRRRLLLYQGLIRWGGDYVNRKDEMHFEINGSLSRCERLAKILMKTPRGKKILAANPGQRAVILS